ncbi:hypothetical protein P7C70_g8093, partial [Phenoliferia sp. Uapishka_3]
MSWQVLPADSIMAASPCFHLIQLVSSHFLFKSSYQYQSSRISLLPPPHLPTCSNSPCPLLHPSFITHTPLPRQPPAAHPLPRSDVDTNLLGTGRIDKAAILGQAGGVWATSPGFDTKQAVLVAEYPEGVLPGDATLIVENLADYLLGVGY